jgi:glycosyltransferase involved in cell wall biosynthesis
MADAQANVDVIASGARFEHVNEVLSKHERSHDSYGPSGLSLVIPAWNEEKRLPATLERYLTFLEAYNVPVEVIVVADGSTDRTAEIAASYESRGVRVLRFDNRLGKGGAVIQGFQRARYDLVGFIDADTPITPVSIAYALAELTNADAAIGSRKHPKSSSDCKRSLSRRASSMAWSWLARAILSMDVKDTQCGAKFFRREAVMQVLPRVTLKNWAFDAALLFHLHRGGFKIVEVPVNWSDDSNSKLQLERVAPAMFLSLLGIRLMSLPFLPRTTRAWAGWLYKQFS